MPHSEEKDAGRGDRQGDEPPDRCGLHLAMVPHQAGRYREIPAGAAIRTISEVRLIAATAATGWHSPCCFDSRKTYGVTSELTVDADISAWQPDVGRVLALSSRPELTSPQPATREYSDHRQGQQEEVHRHHITQEIFPSPARDDAQDEVPQREREQSPKPGVRSRGHRPPHRR